MTTISIGQKYNSLTVIKYSHKEGSFKYYICKCDCGNEKAFSIYNIIKGYSKTCGCALIKHGRHLTSEFTAWREIRYRCFNKKAKHYPQYGGRGITVCDRWMESFNNFFEDMGERPTPKHSLDRINNDGNYEPSNCRWATKQEQSNNRHNTVKCEYNGIVMPLTIWAKLINAKLKTMAEGVRVGKPISFYVEKYGLKS